MKPFPFLLLAMCCSLTFGENYEIIRQVRDASDYEQPDMVQIPPSLCHDDGATECPAMDGRRFSVCRCTCDERFYKSTFWFYNGTWKCQQNSALRRRSAGCQLSLDLHELNDPIQTVPVNISFSRPISNLSTTRYISIPEDATCSLKAEQSMYLTCFGEWKQLNTTLVTKRFYIHHQNRFDIRIQADYIESSSYPLPSGRIIRLAVTCSDRPWEPSQCILLKIQGQIQCPVSSKSSSQKPGKKINGLIIGISLSGVVLLAALIILVCFIIRLRKRRNFTRFINNDTKVSTAEWQKRTTGEEPVYSLPESPINKNNNEQDDHFVLEEPQPHGTQNPDLHEGLQTDKAPHVNETFNEPHQTDTSDDILGYDNALYDIVGNTIAIENP